MTNMQVTPKIADPYVRDQDPPTLVGTKLAKVRAVPQVYAGVTFRSTLEAEWPTLCVGRNRPIVRAPRRSA